MSSKSVKTTNFKFGIVDKYGADEIPRGAASASSNFLTKLDKIELTRGRKRLGAEITGSGKITGLRVGYTGTGTQVLHRVTSGGKLQYYNTTTELWTDIQTSLTNEDHQLEPYRSLAGSQLIMSSKTDGYYKIMVDNHAAVDQNDSTKQPVKGKLRIKRGRSFMWSDQDPTTLYGSYIDDQNVGDQYTAVTTEAIAGSGATRTGTLAFKAGGAKRTCFNVSFTDGTETFGDNFDGTLTGSAGGTGTINYATGDYAITFAAPATTVTSNYFWENATAHGILDFTKSATRGAGEGFTLKQSEGGDAIQNVVVYSDEIYSFKRRRIYKLTLSDDDLSILNKVFSERAGITYWKGLWEDEEGIFFVDDSTENEPKLRVVKPMEANGVVMPQPVTESIDLSGYYFDECDMIGWGDYVCFTGRSASATQNDTLFMFHKIYRSIDKIAWSLSRLEVIDGTLIGGESISQNVYVLFSGTDDDNFGIDASWESSDDDLGTKGLKKTKRLRVKGEIGVNQKIFVYQNFDNSGYQLLIDTKHPDGCIDGSADYVDGGQSISIGATTIGRFEVGGGGAGIIAYPFYTEFRFSSPKFESRKLKFVIQAINDDNTENIGYASITEYEDFGIFPASTRIPKKYLI